MSSLRLAGGPVSWGVDFARHPDNPPYPLVLDGIEAAGLRWIELGPAGYLPTGTTTRDELSRRGLAAVGSFVFGDFHRAAAAHDVRAATAAALDAIVAAEGTLIVLIDRPSPARAATAGRGHAAPRLRGRQWTEMIGGFRRAAEQAAFRGVRAVVHPHAGGYVEFEDEIDRLLDDIAAEELALCLDTGHALYAGSDPAALIARHGDRLEHLHLKDVDATVRDRGLGFWKAIDAGVFCRIGDGLLDLGDLRDALERAGYLGFATVEQDRRPGSGGSPMDDLRRSVARLREAGLGADDVPAG
jgi:inosose dehydratase